VLWIQGCCRAAACALFRHPASPGATTWSRFSAQIVYVKSPRLYRTGLGFDPKGVVNLDLSMNKQALDGDALVRWYEEFGESIGHQPGVKSVSFESMTPLAGSSWTETYQTPVSNGNHEIYMNAVAPEYFGTMRIRMLSGRDFRWDDTRATGRKIILNQAAAKILFPGQNAIGQHLNENGNAYEVIAVVGDVKYRSGKMNRLEHTCLSRRKRIRSPRIRQWFEWMDRSLR
jgi:hypothetical protein